MVDASSCWSRTIPATRLERAPTPPVWCSRRRCRCCCWHPFRQPTGQSSTPFARPGHRWSSPAPVPRRRSTGRSAAVLRGLVRHHIRQRSGDSVHPGRCARGGQAGATRRRHSAVAGVRRDRRRARPARRMQLGRQPAGHAAHRDRLQPVRDAGRAIRRQLGLGRRTVGRRDRAVRSAPSTRFDRQLRALRAPAGRGGVQPPQGRNAVRHHRYGHVLRGSADPS